MEDYGPIWGEIPRFLDNHSVTRLARTCRILSVVAGDELRKRAKRYLKSGNTWEHGFYPTWGYHARRFDDDGNEIDAGEERSWWLRCLCEHHQMLYVGHNCSCGVCLLKGLGPMWTGEAFVQGVRYRRKTIKSIVECSENPIIGDAKLKVHWESKANDWKFRV